MSHNPEAELVKNNEKDAANSNRLKSSPVFSNGKDAPNLDYGFLNLEGLNVLRLFADQTDEQTGAATETEPATEILSALDALQPATKLSLLPTEAEWGAKAIPLPLCEFLAYKSALAYEPSEEIEKNLDKSSLGISHFKFFDSRILDILDTQGFGFLYNGEAYIILRGTESAIDWAGNRDDKFTNPRKWVPPWNKDRARLHTAGQHRGFAKGWAAIRKQVEKWIEEDLPPIQADETRPFIFSGHSLGGALAIIGAYEFEKYFPDRNVRAVVTFGAPLVGDEAFAAEYKETLGTKTVRLESSGDIVPKIMGRWYYRLHRGARTWIERRLADKISPPQSGAFEPVGLTWGFDKTPLLKRSQFDTAITEIARNLAEAIEKKKRQEAEDKEFFDGDTDSETTNKKDFSTDTSSDQPGANLDNQATSNPTDSVTGGAPDAGSPDTRIYYIIGGLAILIIGGFVYLHMKRKFTSSHDIQQRYALYLSALSYRRLRDIHDGNVDLANEDLDRYLQVMRGREGTEQQKSPVFGQVNNLPVRFNKDDDLEAFLRHETSYVI